MATRGHYMLLAGATLLLILGITSQHGRVRSSVHNALHGSDSSSTVTEGAHTTLHGFTPTSHGPSFHEIALKHGTDKVTDHQYHYMYDKYLPAIRNEKIKMLEIGLGCDMGYGPGASYYTWLEYFPNVDLYFIEYNAECAEKWADQTAGATIFPGDQADKAFLRKFIEETGGDFDVIIDDGGHSMVQQETSLELLWKVVKPGGVYFVEDLQTSFMTVSGYGGDPTGGKDPNVHTMLKFIYELIDDRMTPDGTRHAISADMQSIDCMREVCAFFKKTS